MSRTPQQQRLQTEASRGLARWGTVASVLIAMQVGIALIFLLPGADAFLFEAEGSEPVEDLGQLMALLVGIIVFYLGAAIAFVMWMRRASKNLRLLHPNAGFTFSPDGCAGWWFVPFANLWKPFQAMHEIWHHSDPDAERVDVETGYTRQVSWGKAAPPILIAWWTSWVTMSVFDRLITAVAGETALGLTLIGAISAAAAVCCLLVIRQVTAMQRESFARLAEGPAVTSSLGHVVGLDDAD